MPTEVKIELNIPTGHMCPTKAPFTQDQDSNQDMNPTLSTFKTWSESRFIAYNPDLDSDKWSRVSRLVCQHTYHVSSSHTLSLWVQLHQFHLHNITVTYRAQITKSRVCIKQKCPHDQSCRQVGYMLLKPHPFTHHEILASSSPSTSMGSESVGAGRSLASFFSFCSGRKRLGGNFTCEKETRK